MQIKVLSLGYAVPPQSYTQDEVFKAIKYPQVFRRLFIASGIKKRHFWVEPSRIVSMSFQEQQEEYRKGALQLSLQSVVNCLDGRNPREIDCVVFSSCTGFVPGPVIPHYIAKELGLKPGCYFTNIASHGCEGGYPGLKRALDFVEANGGQALAIATELASCCYFPEEPYNPSPENKWELARGNALFADASSCALVGHDNDWRHPTVMATGTLTDTSYIDALGFTWRDGRLRLKISPEVPDIAAELAGRLVPKFLHEQGLCIADPGIDHWIIHPAGNAVLDKIRDRVGIPEEKLAISREVLADFGNCSSSTVGIVAKTLMEKGGVKAGDSGVMLSIGPGMTVGTTLLRWM